MRTDRARVGQGQPDLKAEPRGGGIQRINLQRVVLLGDDDAGIILNGDAIPSPLVGSEASKARSRG
jgi:hypothetical protein